MISLEARAKTSAEHRLILAPGDLRGLRCVQELTSRKLISPDRGLEPGSPDQAGKYSAALCCLGTLLLHSLPVGPITQPVMAGWGIRQGAYKARRQLSSMNSSPTLGCRTGGGRMTLLPHTSCCTPPRMTRSPRRRPLPPAVCQRAHTPSCSTTGETKSLKDQEHATSSQRGPHPWARAAESGCGNARGLGPFMDMKRVR